MRIATIREQINGVSILGSFFLWKDLFLLVSFTVLLPAPVYLKASSRGPKEHFLLISRHSSISYGQQLAINHKNPSPIQTHLYSRCPSANLGCEWDYVCLFYVACSVGFTAQYPQVACLSQNSNTIVHWWFFNEQSWNWTKIKKIESSSEHFKESWVNKAAVRQPCQRKWMFYLKSCKRQSSKFSLCNAFQWPVGPGSWFCSECL